MNRILEHLKSVVYALEKAHSSIVVFALFLREDPLEQWDVIVSAPWLSSSNIDSYRTVTCEMQNYLDGSELVQIARVVILDPNDPVVSFLQGLHQVDNGHFEEINCSLLTEKFGFTIKRAYILRCQIIKSSM